MTEQTHFFVDDIVESTNEEHLRGRVIAKDSAHPWMLTIMWSDHHRTLSRVNSATLCRIGPGRRSPIVHKIPMETR